MLGGGNTFCQTSDLDARVKAVFCVSDERDQWQKRIFDAAREGYLAGYQDGDRVGYERGTRQMEATWAPIVRPLMGPLLAELELRRWGPGGRERFGDPRPGDFAGVAA